MGEHLGTAPMRMMHTVGSMNLLTVWQKASAPLEDSKKGLHAGYLLDSGCIHYLDWRNKIALNSWEEHMLQQPLLFLRQARGSAIVRRS